jgi:deoxyribodipyrimidine photolyase-related protein
MLYFYILPTQLFKLKYLNKLDKEYNYNKIIIWEHPYYFTRYKFNKKKLILHRASMKYYYDLLIDNDYNVSYINFNNDHDTTNKKIHMFDPIDKIVKKVGKNIILHESPNFLLTKLDYQEYRNNTDKFFFHFFYTWCKKKVNIIPNVKSKDKENRKTIQSNIKIPKVPSNKNDEGYIKPAISYINKHFKSNYGDTADFIYPVTHKTANSWLNSFFSNKFKNFGDYQDAIVEGENFLFHSLLSTSINIGLLNPTDIINKSKKWKNKVPINSYEGYIRQLFWREYQRYTYIYSDFNSNYFGNKKKLTKSWYIGTLGINPVDDAIKRGFKYGYLHHIERLMVVGNYMNLSGIAPKEGFKWFMEFSCDSYDWVMHQNVLDMVFFVNGNNNQTMRKPYISSSNYILKMSNYKKDKWSDEWDKLYYNFLVKNKKKLWKFRYSIPTLKNV